MMMTLPRGVFPESLSPHHLEMFSRCQKQFELMTLADLRWPQDPSNFALGTAVHQLLDTQAKGLPLDALLAHANDAVRRCYDSLQASDYGQAPVLASEWDVTLAVGDVWLQGRIDRVVQTAGQAPDDPDARFAIVDWKTGTATPLLPSTHWQTRFYVLVLSQLVQALGISQFRPEAWSMVYVEVHPSDAPQTPPRVTIVPAETLDLKDIGLELERLIRQMKSQSEFSLPKRCPDKYCPYRAVCGIQETPPSEASTES